MASYPKTIKHSSGRILQIQENFLAVRFNPKFNIKDKRKFLDKFNAELEFYDQKNGFITSDRYDWISPNESQDPNFPRGFVDTLEKEFPEDILNVSPVYKFDKVPGRGAYTTIISDVLLIRFSDYIPEKEIPRYIKLIEEYGLVYDKSISQLLGKYHYFYFSPNLLPSSRNISIFELREKLLREPGEQCEGIVDIEFDYLPVYSPLHLKPDDEYYDEQWNMVQINAGGTNTFPTGTGWDENTGSASVIVSVIDRGIHLEHPDLRPNIIPSGFRIDTTLDPAQRVIQGGDPVSIFGIGPSTHGTEVAGIISARIDNVIPTDETDTKIGIAGLAGGLKDDQKSGCKLLSLALVEFSLSNLCAAIAIAQLNGARVINISFGHTGWDTSVISNIIDVHVLINQVVICASTGNDGDSGFIDFPAAHPRVIACGASDKQDLRKNESNYFAGSNPDTGVSVVAPGVNIPTTSFIEADGGLQGTYLPVKAPDGSFISYFGETSAAAAHVSGLAALILSKNSNLTALEVRAFIERNADRNNQSTYTYSLIDGFPNAPWDSQVGYGRINVLETLLAVQDPIITP